MPHRFSFELLATCPHTGARAGVLHTPHGSIETPRFMPVGTLASVKAVPQELLEGPINAPILLANTYHLSLRPGPQVLENAGGLHRFMGWNRALLTDSGGYQVFSLAANLKITDEGARFKAHTDGRSLLLTPEHAVDLQRSIGADITMVLDECPELPGTPQKLLQAVQRTTAWARRARHHFLAQQARYDHPQAQFGIVQGGTDPHLRSQSTADLLELDFEGYAIGGLSVGETESELYDTVAHTAPLLPASKPRYLMGVGTPANLLNCIALGIDLFDCVLPTRNARHAKLYGWDGERNIRNSGFINDHSPLRANSALPWDTRFSHAYLNHLFRAQEPLALSIASAHNLQFYLDLVRTARERILEGNFGPWLRQTEPLLRQKAA